MSKIVIFTDAPVNGKAQIRTQVFLPETLTEEERAKGIEVDSVPPVEIRKGKIAQQWIDLSTKKITVVYVDRDLSPEEEKEQRFIDIEMAIAAILGGGM